ncbi:MAG: lamin tail domain-containing protein [Planctomycetes bacterium]|nr:lamin tail domain-containing protein [Planctomycetota bacterium]
MLIFFISPRLRADLVITEINYHPPGNDHALEFVEIYNTDPVVADLSGSYFSKGIQFIFPPGSFLNGRAYLVVCADEAAVRARYGIANTIGDFTGRLENNGEEIALNLFAGGAECSVDYKNRDKWPAAPDGTGHTLSLKSVFLDTGDPASWAPSLEMGGTPGQANFATEAVITDTVIIPDDAVWKYQKGTAPFSSPAAAWRQAGFGDSSWWSGPTGIGYGDGDDRTVLSDMQNGYMAFAARKAFALTVEQIQGFDQMALLLDFDDGVVAYLNGTEIARANAGIPGEDFPYNQAATGLREAGAFDSFFFSRSILVPGANVLAVQVHNAGVGSTDASFRPKLVGRKVVGPGAEESFPVRINEVLGRAGGGRWLELYNAGDSTFDLSGYALSGSAAALDRFRFPAGTAIAPKGFLVLAEAAAGLDLSALEVQLFLTRPDLQRVVEAVSLANPPSPPPQLAGASDARYPDGGEEWVAATAPTPGAANHYIVEKDLVLNEIHYHPMAFDPRPGPVPGEFLEFYNRGAKPLDLAGYRITKGIDFSFPGGTVLPPGGYLVVAQDPSTIQNVYGLAGVLGPWQGDLSNRGETIRVVDPLGNTVEEVRYFDGGRWPRWADGGGSSLERRDPRQDNASPPAWEASDETGKTSWETVTYTRTYFQQAESEFQIRELDAGECLVDAIQVSRQAAQFVSNGDFEAGTAGWRIEGNHIQSHRTVEDSFQGSSCLKVVATGGGDLRVNRIETDTPAISNGGLTVSLATRWLKGSNLILFSADNHEMPYVHRMAIPADQGTPGRRNSAFTANMGPVIDGIDHAPFVPAAGEAVRISARASDADGVARVKALYRTGSSIGVYTAIDLFDDGGHGDGEAGDGLFAGELPGQPQGTKAVFYLEAQDALGAAERFPREAPEDALVYEHASPAASPLHVYRMVMDDAAWQELNARQLHSNELLPATFAFETSEIYHQIGVRYRGSPWNRPGTPKMLRFRFNEDQRFHGWKSIDLSKWGFEQKERAAYYSVWKNSSEASVAPQSRTINTKLYVNGALHGLMEQIEPVDSDYLRFWFPRDPDGLLYKIVGRTIFNDAGEMIGNTWAQFKYVGNNKELYRWNFNLQTRESEDEFQPLMDLLRKITNATSIELDTQLDQILDVEQFFRVMTTRTAQEDGDTIGLVNGQNAYLYYAPIEGRFKFIPWDLNLSWGSPDTRLFPDGDPGTARLIGRPQFRRLHLGLYDHMLGTYWTVPELSKVLDPVFQVLGQESASADPAGIKNFVAARTPRLRSAVPAKVAFEIRTSGGADFTTNQVAVKLDGTGWVDIEAIAVNGVPYRIYWPSLMVWNIDVPLDFGSNFLQVVALDFQGGVAGTDQITVTSTAGWKAPAITGVQPQAAWTGELVTITGTSFHAGIRAFFGSLESPQVIFNEAQNPSLLQARVAGPVGAVEARVQNSDGRVSPPVPFTILADRGQFIRGDANLDGAVQLSDAVRILLHLFRGAPLSCQDAADADDDEEVAIADAVLALEYLFARGSPPPAPFPQPGKDPQGEALDCLVGM